MLEFLTQDIRGYKVLFYPRVNFVQDERHELITRIGIEALSLNYGISGSLYGCASLQQIGIGVGIGFLGVITWNVEYVKQEGFRFDWSVQLPQGVVWLLAQSIFPQAGAIKDSVDNVVKAHPLTDMIKDSGIRKSRGTWDWRLDLNGKWHCVYRP